MAKHKNNATPFVGVSRLPKKHKYQAHISIYNKTYAREFHTFGQAVVQRLEWERKRKRMYDRDKGVNQHICTENCIDCVYMKWLECERNTPYCDYYLMTENRRPCKAGDNCTVKKPRAKDHNERYRKYYCDSFYHTKEYKWRKARVDSELNIIEK